MKTPTRLPCIVAQKTKIWISITAKMSASNLIEYFSNLNCQKTVSHAIPKFLKGSGHLSSMPTNSLPEN
jgi:hypothetical protein